VLGQQPLQRGETLRRALKTRRNWPLDRGRECGLARSKGRWGRGVGPGFRDTYMLWGARD
jgi:hypothetical protein